MKNISKKVLILLIIIAVLSIFIIPIKNVYAATTYTQSLKSGISNFPKEYQEVLNQIQKLHPNWTFEAYYTGIPWNTLILNETASHGRNRVISNSDYSWKCSCGNLASGYVCASEGITKYYLDPRNFLNEVNIFQFLEISYNSKIHTIDGIKKAVKGTFLDKEVTYTLMEKKEVEVDVVLTASETENTVTATPQIKKEIQDVEVEYTKHYADIILEAAKKSNMSPYSIVTKIIQEVGTKGSSSVSGTYEGYTGYYNFYNLGAYDTGNAIVNGLKYAREKGWNNQYDAIIEGAEEIANSYTNAGQNTAYFYKWDVVGTKILQSGKTQSVSSSNMFWHQYMTNVQDPTSQSKSLYNTYAKNNILDESLNFIIPVYDSMPTEVSMPSGLTTEDGDLYYVNCTDGLAIRESASTSGKKLGTLYKNTLVVMLDRECAEANGLKWDKVKLSNGVTGYIASKYLTFKSAGTKKEYKYEETENNENIIIMTLGITLEKIEGGTAVGEIKTGAKIKIGDKEYTAVVLGDPSGDGEINSADLLKIVKHLKGSSKITAKYVETAADVNNDDVINSADLLKIVKHLKGTSKISF